MSRNNTERTQINIYSTRKIRDLLRQMWAAEIAKRPQATGLNKVVERAILEYARRHHPSLVEKGFS